MNAQQTAHVVTGAHAAPVITPGGMIKLGIDAEPSLVVRDPVAIQEQRARTRTQLRIWPELTTS
jgi:hypothetical protein